MFPVRSALLCAMLLAGVAPLMQAQQPSARPAAPLPAGLLSAQKVFLANAGADPVLDNAFSKAGLANEPWNSFYAALHAWGHWQMLAAPDGADLILEIHAAAPPDVPGTQMPDFNLRLNVRILDGKTHLLLWTVSEPLAGAYRSAPFEKNYQEAIAGLVTRLKALTLPQTP